MLHSSNLIRAEFRPDAAPVLPDRWQMTYHVAINTVSLPELRIIHGPYLLELDAGGQR
jgi:hypothetical protein